MVIRSLLALKKKCTKCETTSFASKLSISKIIKDRSSVKNVAYVNFVEKIIMFPLKLSNFKVFIFKDCESTSFCFQTFNIKKQSFHKLLITLELNDG